MLIGNRKHTILIHDGTFWHVVVLAHSRGAWGVRAVENVAGRNGSRLPEELLAVALSQRAKRVTVLLPGDVHAVRFQTPPDAEPEEIQTALRFESAAELGHERGDLRLVAASVDAFDLDVEPESCLVAGFEDARLRAFSQAVADQGMRFLGAGSFELAAMAWLRRRCSGDARLLLLKESAAFYAAPTLGEIPFVVATLPVGIRPDPDSERERERLERAARQLGTHGDIPLTVLSCGPMSEALQARLAGLFPSPDSVEWHALTDVVGELAQSVCLRNRDGAEQTGLLVGPTPPPRDPHRAGTWLFFVVLLVTLIGVGLKYRALTEEYETLEERKRMWTELEAARKSASERVSALRRQRDAEIAARTEENARRSALRETRALPPGFLPLLDALTDAMPPYTRVERLSEAETGVGIELRGSTRWQEGLPDLVRALNEALAPHGLIVQQDAIELAEGTRREQSFTYRIAHAEAAP